MSRTTTWTWCRRVVTRVARASPGCAGAMSTPTEPSGATGSTLTHLEGGLSRVTYPADELATTDPLDGRPLLARYDLDRAARTMSYRQRDGRGTPRGGWR